jgi:thiamine biosynthesis lipoprotein
MSNSRFRSMGCEIVVGGATDAELVQIRGLFAERDRIFSRFRADSELNRVNAVRVTAVSPEFARTLAVALAASVASDGLVDPTVGEAVVAAGYDRDFDLLEPSVAPAGEAAVPGVGSLGVADAFIRRRRGTTLDLNGVVKSLAADDSVRLLGRGGFVSAGGDVATRGECVVSLPGGAAVTLRSGGMATSGPATRRWLRDGTWHHHLIDPRTGKPSTSRWSYVTVAAGDCVGADVAAKAAFLLDAQGPDWLDERALAGRFVTANGAVVRNAAWCDSVDAGLAAACI